MVSGPRTVTASRNRLSPAAAGSAGLPLPGPAPAVAAGRPSATVVAAVTGRFAEVRDAGGGCRLVDRVTAAGERARMRAQLARRATEEPTGKRRGISLAPRQ